MKQSIGRKILLGIVSLSIACCSLPVCSAENSSANTDAEISAPKSSGYEAYRELHKDYSYDVQEFEINNAHLIGSGKFDENGKVIISDSGSAEWRFTVDKAGFYRIGVTYVPKEGAYSSIEQKVYIDGQIPFEGLNYVTFPRRFSQGEISETDVSGNDIQPDTEQIYETTVRYLNDPSGYVKEDYCFALSAGEHTFRLEGMTGESAVEKIIFSPKEDIPDYSAYISAATYGKTNDYSETVQAENVYYKTSVTLAPATDRSSANTYPQNSSELKLNAMGGTSWKKQGDSISWKINVPEDGLYKLGFRYKQSYVDGCFVSRRIYIDGKTFFKEMYSVRFNYSSNWQSACVGDGENDYLFALSKGEHKITLEAVLGDIGTLLGRAENSLSKLNEIYRGIILVTGSNPDEYRSYNFNETIPDIIKNIEEQYNEISDICKQINSITGSNSEYTTILNKLTRQLKLMYTEPDDNIPSLLSQFKTNIGSFGTWLLSASEQPLMLDCIYILGSNTDCPKANKSVLNELLFQTKCFIASFTQDYNSVGLRKDADYKDELNVWVPKGRDQAQIIRSLSDSMFTEKHKAKVNIKLVSAGNLLPSVLGGNSPDVALCNSMSSVMDYAIRNALYPLSDFKDYASVAERFISEATIPYTYKGKTYALPEELTFPMFFYRTDIFESLGLSEPETWNDFLETIPIIQSQGMNAGIDLNCFYILLYQNGGSLYVNDGERTALDTDTAQAVFKEYTELFTLYQLPVSYDFANRFRTGEMPCGIVNYTTYNQLTVFAPEIKGDWKMIPVPGEADENGIIRHISVADGIASFIMKNSKNKELAWEFLKWWTDSETQSSYGLKMESILGAAAKQPTANTEALTKMSWTSSEYKNIIAQLNDVRAIPQVPGGYYTGRILSFAFNKAYNKLTDPVETLDEYIDELNDELSRRRKEFENSAK